MSFLQFSIVSTCCHTKLHLYQEPGVLRNMPSSESVTYFLIFDALSLIQTVQKPSRKQGAGVGIHSTEVTSYIGNEKAMNVPGHMKHPSINIHCRETLGHHTEFPIKQVGRNGFRKELLVRLY